MDFIPLPYPYSFTENDALFEIEQICCEKFKIFLLKDIIDPRIECNYAVVDSHGHIRTLFIIGDRFEEKHEEFLYARISGLLQYFTKANTIILRRLGYVRLFNAQLHKIPFLRNLIIDDVQFSSVSKFTLSNSLLNVQFSQTELEAIPAKIFTLPFLRRLDLSHNSISFIPEDIKILCHLRELNLTENKIIDVSNLRFLINLKRLYLNCNYIWQIPESFNKLRELRILHIVDDPIKIIPVLPSIENLEIGPLSAHNKHLLDRIAKMSQLRVLGLFDTNFDRISIPQSFHQLKKLRKLIISNDTEDLHFPLFLLYLPSLIELELAVPIDDERSGSILIPQLIQED